MITIFIISIKVLIEVTNLYLYYKLIFIKKFQEFTNYIFKDWKKKKIILFKIIIKIINLIKKGAL